MKIYNLTNILNIIDVLNLFLIFQINSNNKIDIYILHVHIFNI